MNRVLQSSWFAALIGGLIYLGVTAILLTPAHLRLPGPGAVASPGRLTPAEPSWNFRNPEFDQWVGEVKREREALSQREQQLQELQTRLEAERQELTTATQTVYQLQAEFDKNVLRIKTQELDNIKRQAKVISSMSPEAAAGVVNQMPDDDAVRILFTMKADEAATVLESLSKMGKIEEKRAAFFTDRMRRLLPPEPTAAPKTSP